MRTIIIASIVIMIVMAMSAPAAYALNKPVCCADEDGICKDVLVPSDTVFDSEKCGPHKTWTFISENKYCDQMPECQRGCLSIRDREQKVPKQYYEAFATCLDSRLCLCPTHTLFGCDCFGQCVFKPQMCTASYFYEFFRVV